MFLCMSKLMQCMSEIPKSQGRGWWCDSWLWNLLSTWHKTCHVVNFPICFGGGLSDSCQKKTKKKKHAMPPGPPSPLYNNCKCSISCSMASCKLRNTSQFEEDMVLIIYNIFLKVGSLTPSNEIQAFQTMFLWHVYTMHHEVVPRPCKICDWLLNWSWDDFSSHQGENVRVSMEFEVP